MIKRHDSRFTTTYGDEPGTGLGVKSNTVGSTVEPVTSSKVVRANGIYDPLGALREIAIGAHAPTRFARALGGRETGRASAAGFRLEQAWDAVGQLVGQRVGRDPSGLPDATPGRGVERSYAWDHAFAPRRIADARWGETVYGADAAGQVAETRHGDGGSERFSYDPALNLALLWQTDGTA